MCKVNNKAISKMRRSILKSVAKPESLLSRSILVNVIVLVFCACDAVTLYNLFNLLFTDNPCMLILTVTGFTICLDVTVSIAGNVLKGYKQGLRTKGDMSISMVFCSFAFIVSFILYFILRIATKDSLFSGEAYVDGDDVDDLVKSVASLLLGLLPLATSSWF